MLDLPCVAGPPAPPAALRERWRRRDAFRSPAFSGGRMRTARPLCIWYTHSTGLHLDSVRCSHHRGQEPRMLDVYLLGEGGMMPLPGRWLSSVLVRHDGRLLLFDCGEGTQIPLRAAGWGLRALDAICVSHFHGDHVGGLPGLLLSLGNA